MQLRSKSGREKTLRRLFDLGLAFKGIDGALEIIGGALLWVTSPASLNAIIIELTQHELTEDPHDLVAWTLRHIAGRLSANGTLFASVYLFGHGAVKIFLVICLLRNRLWAYPVAILVLLCFVLYQSYRIWLHFSWALAFLTVVDVFIIFLIWHEYRYLREPSG